MDEKHLTAGLSLLANELTDPHVDIDSVIDTVHLRARRRRAVAAAAAGTTVVLVALTTVIATANFGGNQPLGAPPTRTTPNRPTSSQQRPVVVRVVDEEAKKLTSQLSAARASLFPSSLRIDPDDITFPGSHPPALEFGAGKIVYPSEDAHPLTYEAVAKLTDQQGFGTVRISVNGPSLPRPDLLECYGNCTTKEFPDGTRAAWHTHIGDRMGWNQDMAAQRPDGTMIVVSVSVWQCCQPAPTRPEVPLSPDQLYKFATVFKY